jgi:hypothetical protein
VPQETKSDREKRQAARFLDGLVTYDCLECVTPDPPDICVSNQGSPVLLLELTEYHIDDDRVAMTSRWAKSLWPLIDQERRAHQALEHIYGFVVFSDMQLPSFRRRDAQAFSTELLRLATHVESTLTPTEERKISFLARSDVATVPIIPPNWHVLPREDWPLISPHIGAVTFSRMLGRWTRWVCPQTDAGYSSALSSRFRSIFEEKDAKVREGLQDKQRFPGNVPIRLVIVTDMLNDMSSHVFPASNEDRRELEQVIRDTGYTLGGSLFESVWLYSEFSKNKLRLLPAQG